MECVLEGGAERLAAGTSLIVFPQTTRTADFDPSRFNSIGAPGQSVPFPTLFSGVLLLNLFYWCTNQQNIQRTIGARSLADGQKGVLITGGLKLLGPLYLVLPGIIAHHLYAARGIRPDQRIWRSSTKVGTAWMASSRAVSGKSATSTTPRRRWRPALARAIHCCKAWGQNGQAGAM